MVRKGVRVRVMVKVTVRGFVRFRVRVRAFSNAKLKICSRGKMTSYFLVVGNK